MAGKILVGTASWADPSFIETWYPKEVPASERLSWYAAQFNLVELNSSFYGVPNPRLVERWCRQTPEGFLFDVKLHRLLSRHSTDVKTLPPDLQSKAEIKKGKVVLTPSIEKALARRFLQDIGPFSEYHRMGSLLLQFSPSFGPRHHLLGELDDLLGVLQGYSLAIELRNRGWLDEENRAQTEAFFRDRKLAFVCVDAPADPHFMILPGIDLVTNPSLAYLRLHGRNAKGYITGRTVAQRFDYKYSDRELHEITERTVKLAEEAEAVHVIYNNNTANYAPVNAGQFRKILKQGYPEIDSGPEVMEPREVKRVKRSSRAAKQLELNVRPNVSHES